LYKKLNFADILNWRAAAGKPVDLQYDFVRPLSPGARLKAALILEDRADLGSGPTETGS
jgi:hypothetical protein